MVEKEGSMIPESFIHCVPWPWGVDPGARRWKEDIRVMKSSLAFTPTTTQQLFHTARGLNGRLSKSRVYSLTRYLQETLDAYMSTIQRGRRDGLFREGIEVADASWFMGRVVKSVSTLHGFGSLELALGNMGKLADHSGSNVAVLPNRLRLAMK